MEVRQRRRCPGLQYPVLLEERHIVAMHKFNPLAQGREVATGKFKHLRIRFEGKALSIRQVPQDPKQRVTGARERIDYQHSS